MKFFPAPYSLVGEGEEEVRIMREIYGDAAAAGAVVVVELREDNSYSGRPGRSCQRHLGLVRISQNKENSSSLSATADRPRGETRWGPGKKRAAGKDAAVAAAWFTGIHHVKRNRLIIRVRDHKRGTTTTTTTMKKKENKKTNRVTFFSFFLSFSARVLTYSRKKKGTLPKTRRFRYFFTTSLLLLLLLLLLLFFTLQRFVLGLPDQRVAGSS